MTVAPPLLAPSLPGLLGTHQRRPLYSRLPGLYFATPPAVKRLARSLAMRRRSAAGGLEEQYLARLGDPTGGTSRGAALLLTHDVDTAEGFAELPRLLDIEARLGMASLTLVVTHRYPWDRGVLKDWHAGGFAFGVHDVSHDNRLAYLAPAEVRARIERAQAALGDIGTRAFRAPAFLRSAALYEGLAGLVDVDLSAPDWALAWPAPGDGVQTPFPVRHRGVTCLPTTLPRDGELIALGLAGAAGRALVLRKARQLAAIGAPLVLLTHSDPGFTHGPAAASRYRELLVALRDQCGAATLAPSRLVDEVARWEAVEL